MTIGRMTAQKLLRECAAFSALTNAELEKIADSGLEKEYEAGATIHQEGESAEELLLIQEGKVAVQIALPKTAAQASRRLTVDIVTRNEVLDWSAIIEPYTHAFTAACLQKVKVLSLSGIKLRWLLQDDPKIGYGVLKGIINVVALKLYDTNYLLASERSLPPKP